MDVPLLFQVTEDPMGRSLPLRPIPQLKSKAPGLGSGTANVQWVHRWALHPALLSDVSVFMPISLWVVFFLN